MSKLLPKTTLRSQRRGRVTVPPGAIFRIQCYLDTYPPAECSLGADDASYINANTPPELCSAKISQTSEPLLSAFTLVPFSRTIDSELKTQSQYHTKNQACEVSSTPEEYILHLETIAK